MALEIERKFLIDINKLEKLENGYDIKQGYIQTKDKTTVRVRVKGDEAVMTGLADELAPCLPQSLVCRPRTEGRR